uniref:Uncharacterized protein n=1 Tax=Rhizophora mucronata TaxID=61149 RepID=A0A2P2KLX5_RHIMU
MSSSSEFAVAEMVTSVERNVEQPHKYNNPWLLNAAIFPMFLIFYLPV